MAGEESRSRRLGDVGASAPAAWWWGGAAAIPDVLVMLFAVPGKLEAWKRTVQDGSWDAAFEVIDSLDTTDLGGHEPFGFADGISQPEIDWEGERDVAADQITYSNLVAAGEFLLGYRNEYGKYTDRPLVDSTDPTGGGSAIRGRRSREERRGPQRNLPGHAYAGTGRSRLLEVSGRADRCRCRRAPATGGKHGGPDDGGRSRSRRLSTVPIPGIGSAAEGRFETLHVRPRTRRDAMPVRSAYPAREPAQYGLSQIGPPDCWRVVWSKLGLCVEGLSRPTSWLRRGSIASCGAAANTVPGLTPEEALQAPPADDPTRGLHFACLDANIGRQFEFVQNAWLMSTKFDGLSEESDPLLGNRTPVGDARSRAISRFLGRHGVRRSIGGLPQFVTVRGGAYFFLPSLRALTLFRQWPAGSIEGFTD